MFGWLRKKNWQDSPAHLLLLSKFRNGNTPSSFYNKDYWATPLKEKPNKAIKYFIKEGLLGLAGLQELLDSRFKASDLKVMLKKRNLKVSGRKETLIHRLIENDEQSMYELTKGIELYKCTKAGLQLVEGYLEEQKVKRETSEREIIDLLSKKEFSQAVRIVAQYEASQVFPRGLGIDWNNYDVKSTVKSLKTIFAKTPKILKNIEKPRLDKLRFASAMMELFGTNTVREWLPDDFDTGIHLDSDTVSRMFSFHAKYLSDMANYKKLSSFIKAIEISTVDDGVTCTECRTISDKKYKLKDAPELPYPKCTSEIGCRCMAVSANN